jgi:hypothetical protein
MWTDGDFDALVQDIEGEAMGGAGRTRKDDDDAIARKYNTMVLDGNFVLLSASLPTAVAVESCCPQTPALRQESR